VAPCFPPFTRQAVDCDLEGPGGTAAFGRRRYATYACAARWELYLLLSHRSNRRRHPSSDIIVFSWASCLFRSVTPANTPTGGRGTYLPVSHQTVNGRTNGWRPDVVDPHLLPARRAERTPGDDDSTTCLNTPPWCVDRRGYSWTHGLRRRLNALIGAFYATTPGGTSVFAPPPPHIPAFPLGWAGVTATWSRHGWTGERS